MSDYALQAYVVAEREAVAVAAHQELVSGEAEVATVLLLVGTEDVPEFVIQLIYLFTIELASEDVDSPAADGSDACAGEAASEVDVLFWLTIFGTAVHLLRQGLVA